MKTHNFSLLIIGMLFNLIEQPLAQTVTTFTDRPSYDAAIPPTALTTFEDFSSVTTNSLMSTVAPGNAFSGFSVFRNGIGGFGTSGFCPALSDPFGSIPTACIGFNPNAPNVPGMVGSYGPSSITFTPTNETFSFGFDSIDWNDGSQRSAFVLILSNGVNIPVTGPTTASGAPPQFFGYVLDSASIAAGIHVDSIVWSSTVGGSELVGYWNIVTSALAPAELNVTASTSTSALGLNPTIMDADDTVSFSVVFTNNAPGAIGPVTFTSSLAGVIVSCPPGGTNVVTSVPAASSVNCTVTVPLTQSDFDTNGGGDGDIDELVTANFSAGGGTATLTDGDESPITLVPDLNVQKLADQASSTANVAVGQTVTYTYTISNIGNLTISNITLADLHNASGSQVVPTGETLATPGGIAISATTADGASNNIWDDLGPGDLVEFTGTYVVTQDDINNLQ